MSFGPGVRFGQSIKENRTPAPRVGSILPMSDNLGIAAYYSSKKHQDISEILEKMDIFAIDPPTKRNEQFSVDNEGDCGVV